MRINPEWKGWLKMLDQDLLKLIARDEKTLDRLEGDIWRREAEDVAAKSAARKIGSWQAAIALVAVIGSASLGASLALASRYDKEILFSRGDLSPAKLLLGGSP